MVDPETAHSVEVLLDPAPYRPRKNSRLKTRLKKEFYARAGDQIPVACLVLKS